MNRIYSSICRRVSLGILPLFIVTLLLPLAACIEDGIATSPQQQPLFSTDTLSMGTVFTNECTTTFSMKVYNRHPKILRIESLKLRGDNPLGTFRINVDGHNGTSFSDVEIRPNDSIYIFVEATLPVNGSHQPVDVIEHLDFITNGVSSEVTIAATGQDVERLRGRVIDANTRWDDPMPRIVMDSLLVSEGAVLTLGPGTRLMFHDAAYLQVYGSLKAAGTSQAPIEFTGDRTGNVVADISFDLMSNQWGGISFAPSSTDNWLEFVTVKNSSWGMILDGATPTQNVAALTLRNCRLRNNGSVSLTALGSSVDASRCEIAEAALTPLLLAGGNHTFNHCTISNYYLFSLPAFPLVNLDDLDNLSVIFSNTILYGMTSELSPGDVTGLEVYFLRCLFKSKGEDDEQFIDCLWDEDPCFGVDRSAYVFDYRLQPESPALQAAYSSLDADTPASDYWGVVAEGALNLGAYN